jgi:nitrate/nitrite transport system permease protein
MAAIVGSRRVSSKQQKVINKFLIKKVIPPLFGLFVFLMLWELLCLIPSFQLPGIKQRNSGNLGPFCYSSFFR